MNGFTGFDSYQENDGYKDILNYGSFITKIMVFVLSCFIENFKIWMSVGKEATHVRGMKTARTPRDPTTA